MNRTLGTGPELVSRQQKHPDHKLLPFASLPDLLSPETRATGQVHRNVHTLRVPALRYSLYGTESGAHVSTLS